VTSASPACPTPATSADTTLAPGAAVRPGILFRADAPANAVDTDLAILRRLDIVQVIELRGETEIATFGIGTWDSPRIHLPVADTAQGILTRLAEAARTGTADVSTARQMMIESYRQFVSDPQAREQFAAAPTRRAGPMRQ
jgi:protein tyrosine/serine phosphatase